jgi:nucleoside-diphosphate-sugar epimerase
VRVLVLGGTRFIGAAAVRRLVAAGHEVACFHRGKTNAPLPSSVDHILGDRAQLSESLEAFRAFAPELILDQRPLCEADALAVMALAHELGVRRVVAISSMDVYKSFGVVLGKETWPEGRFVTEVQDEDAPLREVPYPHRGEELKPPGDPLEWTNTYDKIPAEAVFMGDPELPGTVLRLPMVYGPADYHRRPKTYTERMFAGAERIQLEEGFARWETARGYIDDVAQGVALAVCDERAAGRIYNVCEEEFLSEEAWVRALAEAAGWEGELALVNEHELEPEERPGIETRQHLRLSSARIRAELGYQEELSLAERIARTVGWEREQA